MKISMAVAGAVLLASTLAACSGDDDGGGNGDYCKDLKQAVTSYGSLSEGDFDKLDAALKTFHKLADEAPSEIEDEWKQLDGAFKMVEDALEDAGLTFADIATIQQGEIPEGIDASKLQGLASDMAKLSNAEATKASEAIEAHAKKTCKVDFNAL